MNRSWITAALVALLAAGGARAQAPDTPAPAQPVDILTSPTSNYPPGTYVSPWRGEGGQGSAGILTYEVFPLVGVSLPVGGGPLASALKTGIETGGVARTLYFRADHTAAWVFDLGVTYTYNRGQGDQTRNVATPRTSPVVIDPFTGQQTGGERIFPDGLADYQVRGLARTSLNFGIGRDWWLWGPGSVQTEEGYNFRFGTDVGGRWGTGHVDLVPRVNPDNYLKRSGVFHGVYIGMHMSWERPVGAWILTTGLRTEWGYTMTNLIPPLGGDIHDVNILLTVGARF